MKQLFLVFLAMALQCDAFSALSAAAIKRLAPTFMVAGDRSRNNDTSTEPSLSELTDDMLRSHREMKSEMKAMETAFAAGRGIAQAGEDGVYRIFNEEQYQ